MSSGDRRGKIFVASPLRNFRESSRLSGSERSYRIRVGDYRILYDVLAHLLVIEIIRVGHRRDVYDR